VSELKAHAITPAWKCKRDSSRANLTGLRNRRAWSRQCTTPATAFSLRQAEDAALYPVPVYLSHASPRPTSRGTPIGLVLQQINTTTPVFPLSTQHRLISLLHLAPLLRYPRPYRAPTTQETHQPPRSTRSLVADHAQSHLWFEGHQAFPHQRTALHLHSHCTFQPCSSPSTTTHPPTTR
jgi:hypothetical protein